MKLLQNTFQFQASTYNCHRECFCSPIQVNGLAEKNQISDKGSKQNINSLLVLKNFITAQKSSNILLTY